MKVNTINNEYNTNFGAIIQNSVKLQGTLFKRLKKPKWNMQYDHLYHTQEKNKINIILDSGKNNRLEAVLSGPNGVILKEQENIFRGMFNLSPIKFIKKMCKLSNEYSKNLSK